MSMLPLWSGRSLLSFFSLLAEIDFVPCGFCVVKSACCLQKGMLSYSSSECGGGSSFSVLGLPVDFVVDTVRCGEQHPLF